MAKLQSPADESLASLNLIGNNLTIVDDPIDVPHGSFVLVPVEFLLAHPAPYNPRRDLVPEDSEFQSLQSSLGEFGVVENIVWNKRTGNVVGGHQRIKTASVQGISHVPTCVVDIGLNKERLLNLALNKIQGTWDSDRLIALLADLQAQDLAAENLEIGLSGFSDVEINELLKFVDYDAGNGIGGGGVADDVKQTLSQKFVIPPFTVFDARQGYWQARKHAWIALGIQSEAGRGENLLKFSEAAKLHRAGPKKDERLTFKLPAWADRGPKVDAGKKSGTSIFDPVLCEVIDRWFCPKGGSILDPFAGGSVRGIVAAALGRKYTGIDLSKVQIEANRSQWDELEPKLMSLGITEIEVATPFDDDETEAAPGAAPAVVTDVEPTGLADLPSILKSFRKVTPDAQKIMAPYMAGYMKRRKSPPFFIGFMWMAECGFLWGIVDNCLCIVKRAKIHQTYMIRLAVAPMSLSGDIEEEKAVIRKFLSFGVATRLTDEDVEIYGHIGTFDDDKEDEEYIYSLDYLLPENIPAGKAGRHWRYVGHTLDKLVESGDFKIRSWKGGEEVPKDVLVRCGSICEKWAKERNDATDKDSFRPNQGKRYLAMFNEFSASCPWEMKLTFIEGPSGEALAFLIYQIVDHSMLNLAAYYDYERKELDKIDICRTVHYMSTLSAYETLGHSGVFNSGSGGGQKGLVAAKEKLDPVKRLKIRLLHTDHKFTQAEWKATDPFAGAAPKPSAVRTGLDVVKPTWVVGNALNCDTLAPGEYDLIMTCPPYADLEVYSDNPEDLSTMDYDAFLVAYREIIKKACAMLKPDRFAAIVVGEVRNKKSSAGSYRGFVPDTIRAFEDAGLEFYNEAILVTAVGSLPIRINRQFNGGRKLGKTHQNILVFVKGDPAVATKVIGPCEAGDAESMFGTTTEIDPQAADDFDLLEPETGSSGDVQYVED